MVVICIILMISDIEHLFICLLAISVSSLEKYLARSFAYFLTGFFVVVVVVVLVLSLRLHYNFWILIPIRYIIGDYVLPFSKFFSFSGWFHICPKTFCLFFLGLPFPKKIYEKKIATINVPGPDI